MEPSPKSLRRNLTHGCTVGLAAVSLVAGGALAGIDMPPTIRVAGKELKLNGAGTQSQFVFDVYVVALYMQRPTHDAREALRSNQAKQIRVRMLRDASSADVVNALRGGLNRSGANLPPVHARMERLFAAVPDFKSGEELLITYVPGRGTLFQARNGESITFAGKDFAEAIFSIWLGNDPGTEHVKQKMLGN